MRTDLADHVQRIPALERREPKRHVLVHLDEDASHPHHEHGAEVGVLAHPYDHFRPRHLLLYREPRDARASLMPLDLARSTLPKFQQALRLLNDVGDYPSTVNVEIRQQLEAAQTYIEIQEAIIRRGR
jgi:hypothetical protein